MLARPWETCSELLPRQGVDVGRPPAGENHFEFDQVGRGESKELRGPKCGVDLTAAGKGSPLRRSCECAGDVRHARGEPPLCREDLCAIADAERWPIGISTRHRSSVLVRDPCRESSTFSDDRARDFKIFKAPPLRSGFVKAI